jgi:Dehydrogenases with different specificities (related to short-chain alcohol dehydrogenases)
MPERYDEQPPPDYANMLRLDGRHVLVIGGGRGIGRQASLAVAAVGANVSVVDLDETRAGAVARETGGLAITADASSMDSLRAAFESATARFGPVQGAIDIIGIAQWAPIAEIDEENFNRTMDLNLGHAFRTLRLMTEFGSDAGSSVVFVSSISGFRSAPMHATYGAAKAGLNNLVGSAAVELGPTIRVNAVAPGQTRTPRMVARHADDAYYWEAAKQVPLGRVGETWDIASALLYFVSDLSQWVTGQVLVVDGGAGRRYQYQ